MAFCGFTGGRREKRSPNYLCVKNPFTEKRDEKRERKYAARKKRREKERTKRDRGDTMRLNS